MVRHFLLPALVMLATGCSGFQGLFRWPRGLPPTMDRLVAAYDDLANRKLQVIADCEDPVQATLFRLDPADTGGFVGITTDRAQLQTGVGSLKVTFAHAGVRLVCGSHPDSQWGFPRDWSKYHLFILSVYSPRQLGGFIISARSGTDVDLRYENPPLLLKPGWNLIRLDLGDMGEQLDLANMRDLEFRCEPLTAPVDLFFDDLILTDNARDLYSTPEKLPGDLYVRSAGRRLIVGAVDRFELTFSRGRIRQWLDLGFDRTRIHNLVGIGSLGPDPIPAAHGQFTANDADNPAGRMGAGTTLETYQSLVSANALRVVVQGAWRFTPPNASPSETDPYSRWLYSIYRDGRVYTECVGLLPAAEATDQVAMRFACDGGAGFQMRMAASSQDAASAQESSPDDYLLFSRAGKGQSDLLIVPYTRPTAGGRHDRTASRISGSWLMNAENGAYALGFLIRVWPPDIDSPEQAAPMAADYRHPFPLHLDAGRLVRTDPGDFDNDGFSEAHGYYVLQLDGSIAKVRIDGGRTLRFSPVFKLVDVANRDVWAYLDGRQIRDMIRDEDGNIIFVIPETISREVLLEITSRAAGEEAG